MRWAVAEEKPLEVIGQGSKRAVGRPSQTDLTLDLSGLTGVTLYEPEELVLSAKAGTPIAEIEALLDSTASSWPSSRWTMAPLFGAAGRAAARIGGVVAANLSGPRRIKAGAARDHVLGITAVSGRGETFKSGGRVVKNVTGYDLCKVLAGSWGTLAAMTESPSRCCRGRRPRQPCWSHGLTDAQRLRRHGGGDGHLGCDVSGAAHLPDACRRPGSTGLPQADAATVFRIEGVAPSVAHRREQLAAHAEAVSARSTIARRDRLACAVAGRPRREGLCGASARRSAALARLDRAGAAATACVDFDHAGGADVLRLGRRPRLGRHAATTDDGGAGIRAHGGRRARRPRDAHPRAGRRCAPRSMSFEPQEPGVRALSRRVKESFDPKGVLNPGRMWAGV